MAKIYYSLYDRMLQEERLLQAFAKVKSSKGAPGVDGRSIEDFAEDLSEEVALLASELRQKSYRPQRVKRVEIPKACGGTRLLGIPIVRDRVVRQAPLNILQPISDPEFHHSSYGYRPGKNQAGAIAKASLFIRKHSLGWVADMDLSRRFDTPDHDFILKSFRRRIVDGSILALLRIFLQGAVDDRGGVAGQRGGQPPGRLRTSQQLLQGSGAL